MHTHTHRHTQAHTHRVPVDNVGNWVLGCCFRLTDSSPSLLILFSYASPLSVCLCLALFSFVPLIFWYDRHRLVPLRICCVGCTFKLKLHNHPVVASHTVRATPAPCNPLSAACFLPSASCSPVLVAVVWWVSPWESKYVLLFPARFFIHVFLTSDPFS